MGNIFHDNDNDIKDDEIRIIRSISSTVSTNEPMEYMAQKSERKRLPKTLILSIVAIVIFLVVVVLVSLFAFVKRGPESDGPDELEIVKETPLPADTQSEQEGMVSNNNFEVSKPGFVEIRDTTVNKIPLAIFTPKNAVPKLHIGVDALRDSAAVLVVQAADIRRDNGGIVGAYVLDGDLISRGQSKSGFCAIINGKLIIGVADATPYLEQAIETDGYFFRQYPLVVGGQIVENKPQNSSLRKALAELDGEIVVIMSQNRMTLNDFAQSLVDLGVSNAIYLIGSSAFGFAKDSSGNRVEFGVEQPQPSKNTNYLIWE